MLVLSRKKTESLVIAGDIRVFVIDIKGDSVRLGIEAAKTVPVHRHEVFERLSAQRLTAERGSAGDLERLEKPRGPVRPAAGLLGVR
jgi:carbon storage regulator